MKQLFSFVVRCRTFLPFGFVIGLALCARAGVNFELHLYRYNADGYAFYTPLTTNGIGADAPLGTYIVNSPGWPTNGSTRTYEMTTNGLNITTGSEWGYADIGGALQQITNGTWTLLFTNSTSTNVYTFSVSVSGLSSNMLPATVTTYPINAQTGVTNHPVITWDGPTDWPVSGSLYLYNDDFSFFQFASPLASETSYAVPVTMPPTNYNFQLNFVTNYTTSLFTTTTPVRTNDSQLFPDWTYSTALESSTYITFTVTPPSASFGHTIAAYYSFEDNNLFAHDFSGHGNDIVGYSWFVEPPHMTNDSLAGSYAVGFTGSGSLNPKTNLVSVFSQSFSVSVWLKTSDVHGNDYDDEYSAAGIVSALSGDYSHSVMPMGLTGSKLAFYTGGDTQDTLHSQASINTGDFVHVVVTRDQSTGEKKIYINGALDSSEFASSGLLNGSDPEGLSIGENNGQGFNGVLDEVQFYSGVLSAAEVMQLYNNPGTTIADVSASANGIVAHYDFDEGTEVAPDVSGHGNDIVQSGIFGSGVGPMIDPDAIAGVGSVYFDGESYLAAPSNLLATLAGDFSLSIWVKTTDTTGSPYDLAWQGACIVSADQPTLGADLIPLALTGGQAAFNTANTEFNYDDTINSGTLVNDDTWHHIVVTRNQATGEKKIYIDGVLDVSDVDSTNLLNSPLLLTIGCKADASDPDPTSPFFTGSNGYTGLADDVQIYNRPLSATEVDFLYNNPGSEVPAPENPSVLAYYKYDDSGDLGIDSSGNNYSMNTGGGWNGGGSASDTENIAGGGAIAYYRDSMNPDSGGFNSWDPMPTNLLSALAGDFSISLWVKTTDNTGSPYDFAYFGAGIVSAEVPGLANDLIPVALTGGQVAFNTGGDFDDTLNSSTVVNDDTWHHIVVTRKQTTGEKRIYIDGVLDTSAVGTTNLLNDPLLITIGAIGTASQTDPSFGNYNGYEGLLDDLQFYGRTLNPAEVDFLYNNPGQSAPVINGAGPVDVEFQLSITRNQDLTSGDSYYCFPAFISITPSPVTTHRIESPNGFFSCDTNSSGSVVLNSLDSVLNECTNGLWKLYINKGDVTEKIYTFSVSITGLDTNLLKPVMMLSPTNGSMNVPVNPVLNWSGPVGFNGIFAELYQPFLSGAVFTNFPGDATNWPSPPTLNPGTNRLYLSFHTNDIPLIVFTTPVDDLSNPIHSWSATAHLNSDATSEFVVVSNTPPIVVQILNPSRVGSTLQFSFVTQSGHPHTIEARTNLTLGTWVELTNFPGDGSLKQFSFPTTNPPMRFFRVRTD